MALRLYVPCPTRVQVDCYSQENSWVARGRSKNAMALACLISTCEEDPNYLLNMQLLSDYGHYHCIPMLFLSITCNITSHCH